MERPAQEASLGAGSWKGWKKRGRGEFYPKRIQGAGDKANTMLTHDLG